MRERLAVAPPWIQGLLVSIADVVGLVVFFSLVLRFELIPADTYNNNALRLTVPFWAITGAFAGVTAANRSRKRRERSGVASLPAPDRHGALRAAAGGAVPADPRVREAAWRHAEDLLRTLQRQRPATLIICGVVIVGGACLTVVNHSLALLPVLILVVLAGVFSSELQIRQIRRSAARLTG